MFFTLKLHKRLCLAIILLITLLVGIIGINVHTNSSISKTAMADNGIKLPILMYHSVIKDSSKQGKYVVTPDTFENDLKFLKEHGYTSIVMQDLIDYVNSGKALPEKPVMITFDDGYYNNYVYAYPLAQKYNYKLVISPIGYYSDMFTQSNENNVNYSHMTWPQINEMMQSGYVEFQNHTYNLHSSKKGSRLGAKKLKEESLEEYTKMLEEDVGTMQKKMTENTGYTPTTFVYPFGAISNVSLPIIKELGFQGILTCEEKMNTITEDAECLYGLGRYLRPAGISTQNFFAKLKMD